MITMIVTAYAAVSVTFSIGFAAGAWWASRARINRPEIETMDLGDRATAVGLRRPSIFYARR